MAEDVISKNYWALSFQPVKGAEAEMRGRAMETSDAWFQPPVGPAAPHSLLPEKAPFGLSQGKLDFCHFNQTNPENPGLTVAASHRLCASRGTLLWAWGRWSEVQGWFQVPHGLLLST